MTPCARPRSERRAAHRRPELRWGPARAFASYLACSRSASLPSAAVGSVREAIQEGLSREGATILGGDAEMSFTYRFASDAERAHMDRIAEDVSETVDFRSHGHRGPEGEPERALTQVRGVDGAYPLYGEVVLDPAMPLSEALATEDPARHRDAAPPQWTGWRLAFGDTVRLGTQDFELRAVLENEPDGAAGGFALGPRSIVPARTRWNAPACLHPARSSTRNTGSPCPRMRTSPRSRPRQRRVSQIPACAGAMRANGAPGVQEFVDRIGAFLVPGRARGAWQSAVSACRPPCAPIWMPRSPPNRHAQDAGGRGANDLHRLFRARSAS